MDAVNASRVHSARRCYQRYGFFLSRDAVAKIVATIQRGQAIKLCKLTNTRVLFAVEIEHHRTILPVIYSNTRKTIVTVLPEHALDAYRAKIAARKSTEAVKTSTDAVEISAETGKISAATVEESTEAAVEAAKPAAPAPAIETLSVSLVLPAPPLLVTFVSQLGPLLILTVRKKKQPRIFIGYSVEDGIRRLTHVEVRGSVRTDWATAAPMLKRKMARLVADEPDCSQAAKEAWCERTVAEIRQAIEAQQVIVEGAGQAEAANQPMSREVNAAAA